MRDTHPMRAPTAQIITTGIVIVSLLIAMASPSIAGKRRHRRAHHNANAEQHVSFSVADVHHPQHAATEDAPEDQELPGEKTIAAATVTQPAIAQNESKKRDYGFFSAIWQRRYLPAWGTLGAGVAVLSGGIAFGAIAQSANQRAHDATVQPEAWTLRNKAQKNALAANILMGIGGAAVITSTILFYLEYQKELKQRRQEITLELDITKGGGKILLAGRF